MPTHIFREDDGAEFEVQYEHEPAPDPEPNITYWRQVGAKTWICYSYLDKSTIERWEWKLEQMLCEEARTPEDWSNATERYAA